MSEIVKRAVIGMREREPKLMEFISDSTAESLAIAVIQTLREPTVEQIAAGWQMLRREKQTVRLLGAGPGLKEAYTAMIETALK